MTCSPRPTPSFGEALGPEGRAIPSGFKAFRAVIGIRFWKKVHRHRTASHPRRALRKVNREALESNCPPMLAAQSDFPSGPLSGFIKYSIN